MPTEFADHRPVAPVSRPVIYHRGDYVGLFRHLLIFAVDGVVIWIGAAFVFVLVSFATGTLSSREPSPIALIATVAFAWWYLAVLKASQFRSPGYWAADARIVTLYGERPSPWHMTMRLLWSISWLVGFPVSIYTDLLWTSMDDNRQMLRDVICETRLIRHSAKPAATGKLSYCLFTGLGITLFYSRIR